MDNARTQIQHYVNMCQSSQDQLREMMELKLPALKHSSRDSFTTMRKIINHLLTRQSPPDLSPWNALTESISSSNLSFQNVRNFSEQYNDYIYSNVKTNFEKYEIIYKAIRDGSMNTLSNEIPISNTITYCLETLFENKSPVVKLNDSSTTENTKIVDDSKEVNSNVINKEMLMDLVFEPARLLSHLVTHFDALLSAFHHRKLVIALLFVYLLSFDGFYLFKCTDNGSLQKNQEIHLQTFQLIPLVNTNDNTNDNTNHIHIPFRVLKLKTTDNTNDEFYFFPETLVKGTTKEQIDKMSNFSFLPNSVITSTESGTTDAAASIDTTVTATNTNDTNKTITTIRYLANNTVINSTKILEQIKNNVSTELDYLLLTTQKNESANVTVPQWKDLFIVLFFSLGFFFYVYFSSKYTSFIELNKYKSFYISDTTMLNLKKYFETQNKVEDATVTTEDATNATEDVSGSEPNDFSLAKIKGIIQQDNQQNDKVDDQQYNIDSIIFLTNFIHDRISNLSNNENEMRQKYISLLTELIRKAKEILEKENTPVVT